MPKKSQTEPKEQQKQQQMMQFQLLQQQIEQHSQQLELLSQQLQELEISQDALNQLTTTKTNTDILATICPGIFVKASLKDNQNLIVNVGANTTVEKTPQQVIKMLEEQKEELQKTLQQADTVLQNLTQQAIQLYGELNK